MSGILHDRLSIAFFEGTPSFNFWSFSITSIGTLWALWQSWRAKKQTSVVAKSLRELRSRMQTFSIAIQLGDLCAHCQEICSLLQSRKFDAAAMRIRDLHNGLGRVSNIPGFDQIRHPADIRLLEVVIRNARDFVQQIGSMDDKLEVALAECQSEMNDVNAQLMQTRTRAEFLVSE